MGQEPTLTAIRGTDRRPTIADVARLAGVSKATVSRVLNEVPGVTAAKVEAVLAVVRQVGFVPSQSAVSLARGRALSIGLLAPALSRPWMLEILRGVTEAIEDTDFSLTLYTMSRGATSFDALLSQMRRQAIDGLVVMQPPESGEELQRIFAAGVPVVVIDDRGAHRNLPSVGSTDEQGITDAVHHLVGLGRQYVTMLAGPQNIACHRDRLAAFKKAIQAEGLSFDDDLVRIADDDSYEAGGRAAHAIVEKHPRLDAVVVGNDAMALGALRRLQQEGRRVPQDVSVTGFDDVAAARHSDPSLTTIYNPLYEMGGTAVSLLLDACDGRTLPSEPVLLPTRLVVRASTGAANTTVDDDLVHWYAEK
jgi:LacI family transcriptional regulator